MTLVVPRHKCYCGSDYCGPFQCRFYMSREQYETDTAEFWANWDEAARRLDEEIVHGK